MVHTLHRANPYLKLERSLVCLSVPLAAPILLPSGPATIHTPFLLSAPPRAAANALHPYSLYTPPALFLLPAAALSAPALRFASQSPALPP